MKKILPPIVIVAILVLSGLGAVATPSQKDTSKRTDSVSLSAPTFSDTGNYVTVTFPESTSMLIRANKPMLPVYTKSYDFPVGTIVSSVNVNVQRQTYAVSKLIRPSPEAVPLIDGIATSVADQDVLDQSVYSSAALYPSDSYSVEYGVGLDKNDNTVLHVVVRCYAQYAPALNTVSIPTSFDVSIQYVPTSTPSSTGSEEFKLLIITPQKFESAVQPLVDHKTSIGLPTIVKTVEDIYTTYTDGRDEPEKIKLCVFDMKNTYNITYVLLVGGRKGESLKWYIPERRTNGDDGWESGYASDLYYSDLLKYNQSSEEYEFEDWDSNHNDVFAEWKGMKKDVMDFYPDVHIGRLACRYTFEVKNAVNKIIAYETTALDPSWYKTAYLVAGDTFPPEQGGDYGDYEGELETDVGGVWLESDGFTVERLWTSLGTLTGRDDVLNAFNTGAGFVYFAGHGNPTVWSTHPPNDMNGTWIQGLQVFDMPKLKNKDALPVVLVGGCHNAQFNSTLAYIIEGILTLGIKKYFHIPEEGDSFLGPFWKKEWIVREWASWLVLQKKGGAIGCMGMASLGYGYINDDTVLGLGGWIEPRYFDAFVNQSIDFVGAAHDQAISDYITYIGGVNTGDVPDRKTVDAWVLMGDPSIKMGGYA